MNQWKRSDEFSTVTMSSHGFSPVWWNPLSLKAVSFIKSLSFSSTTESITVWPILSGTEQQTKDLLLIENSMSEQAQNSREDGKSRFSAMRSHDIKRPWDVLAKVQVVLLYFEVGEKILNLNPQSLRRRPCVITFPLLACRGSNSPLQVWKTHFRFE